MHTNNNNETMIKVVTSTAAGASKRFNNMLAEHPNWTINGAALAISDPAGERRKTTVALVTTLSDRPQRLIDSIKVIVGEPAKVEQKANDLKKENPSWRAVATDLAVDPTHGDAELMLVMALVNNG